MSLYLCVCMYFCLFIMYIMWYYSNAFSLLIFPSHSSIHLPNNSVAHSSTKRPHSSTKRAPIDPSLQLSIHRLSIHLPVLLLILLSGRCFYREIFPTLSKCFCFLCSSRTSDKANCNCCIKSSQPDRRRSDCRGIVSKTTSRSQKASIITFLLRFKFKKKYAHSYVGMEFCKSD